MTLIQPIRCFWWRRRCMRAGCKRSCAGRLKRGTEEKSSDLNRWFPDDRNPQKQTRSPDWLQGSHKTHTLTSTHKRIINLRPVSLTSGNRQWSQCRWFLRPLITSASWYEKTQLKSPSHTDTNQTNELRLQCISHKSAHHCVILTLFSVVWFLSLFPFKCHEPGRSHTKGIVPEWHPAARRHAWPGAAGRAVSWGVQTDARAGDLDRSSAAHTPSPGGREEEDRQVWLCVCLFVFSFCVMHGFHFQLPDRLWLLPLENLSNNSIELSDI